MIRIDELDAVLLEDVRNRERVRLEGIDALGPELERRLAPSADLRAAELEQEGHPDERI